MQHTATVSYDENLRTEIIHTKSGVRIHTDAPLDNNGKGESFSPTDLTSASLGACMLTIMGIVAEKNDIPFTEARATITKHMVIQPRRIGRLEIEISIKGKNLDQSQKRLLENGAIHCPVAKSLHPEIEQIVQFEYYMDEKESQKGEEKK